jgi:hypothetical protein
MGFTSVLMVVGYMWKFDYGFHIGDHWLVNQGRQ